MPTSLQFVELRRIKCDETKPNCVRCTSTGRKCDGYRPIQPSRNCNPSATPVPANTVVTVNTKKKVAIPRSTSPHFTVDSDALERRSFHFFRTRTVPQLCGFFDDEIWERLVLQATLQEPAIRQAVLALGSLHERFEKGDLTVFASNLDKTQGGLALRQYTQAISHLIARSTPSDSRSLDVCLIASVLFACFETLRGHYGSAVSHLMSGVRILEETMVTEDCTNEAGEEKRVLFPYVSKEKLLPLFNRLDSQVQQLIGTMPMTLQTPRQAKARPLGFGFDVPETFRTLEEARNSLSFQTNGFVKFFKEILGGVISVEADIEMNRAYWFNQLHKWEQAFERFLQKSATTLGVKAQQAAWALKINQRMGSMNLRHGNAGMLTDEASWDLYKKEGEEIVGCAEHIVTLDDFRRGTAPDRKIEFSLDMWIVGPVYAVAHKCRDPALRRRAIALLKKAQRQEGLWDSTIAARVAERILAIEEGAVDSVTCARDIPIWARVSGVIVEFDKQERRGSFTYTRPTSLQQPLQESYQEYICW